MVQIKISILTISMMVLILVVPSLHFVEAQDVRPITVSMGVYIVNIGRFDVGTGSFTADFYLWFSWKGNWSLEGDASGKAFPERFELMNGKIDKITLLDSSRNLPGGYNYLLYRIQASLTDPVNLQDYPLDQHNLTIEVEDQILTISDLVYEPDSQSGVDSLVRIQGWDILATSISSKTREHLYKTTFGFPNQNHTETYSRFVFTLPIYRPVLSSLIKTMIPIMVILLIAMISFLVKPENFGPRISLNVTTFLAAVANHLNLTASIPPVGFLTLADRLMISVYIVLVYALAVTVGLAAISNERRLLLVKRLNQTGGVVAPIAAIILVGMQFFL